MQAEELRRELETALGYIQGRRLAEDEVRDKAVEGLRLLLSLWDGREPDQKELQEIRDLGRQLAAGVIDSEVKRRHHGSKALAATV